MPHRVRLLLRLFFVLCIGMAFFFQGRSPMAPPASPVISSTVEEPKGLFFRLSNAVQEPQKRQLQALPEAKTLSQQETDDLLARLPKLPEESQTAEFSFPERTLHPPKTGEVISASFPPSTQKETPTPASGALTILQMAPQGDVVMAAQLAVTFSQPMVSLGSEDEPATAEVPVKLHPQPPGQWRWMGNRILLCQPTGRFPMATEYTVEVPAGVRSASGSALNEGKRWTFRTPPPSLVFFHPMNTQADRNPLMYAEFDQRINPKTIAGTIRIRTQLREWGARLASEGEIEKDNEVKTLSAKAPRGQWIAFRIVSTGGNSELLPPEVPVTVTLGPDLPSAEGPQVAHARITRTFRTFGPLRIVGSSCPENCSVPTRFLIQFNNPLDPDHFWQSFVQVDPPIFGLDMSAWIYPPGEGYLNIWGDIRPRTRYRVSLRKDISDVFGQRLGERPSIAFGNGISALVLPYTEHGKSVELVRLQAAIARYARCGL